MSDFSYTFLSQLDQFHEIIDELIEEEAEGTVEMMRLYYRFSRSFSVKIADEYETHSLCDSFGTLRREHLP